MLKLLFSAFIFATLTLPSCLEELLLSVDGSASVSVSEGNIVVTTDDVPPAPSAPAKNVILIILDDADINDFGFNNDLIQAPDAVTPYMSGVREEGVRLTRYRSGAAVCSPSRVALLTGSNPARFGWNKAYQDFVGQTNQAVPAFNGIPFDVPQLGSLMQEAGKTTGHFGKWHVGSYLDQYGPNALGFDKYQRLRSIPSPRDSWAGPARLFTDEGEQTVETEYLDRIFFDGAIDFIEDNADGEFFIHLQPFTPHFPWAAPSDFDNTDTGFDLTTNRGQLLGMMYEVDKEIGRMIDTLKDQGIYDETLIVITSDNGGTLTTNHPNSYANGAKGNLFSGGTNVSAIMRLPEHISANTENLSDIAAVDLMPTLLEFVGFEMDKNIDGVSFADAIMSGTNDGTGEVFYELDGGSAQDDGSREMKTYSLLKDGLLTVKLEGRDPLTHARPYFVYDLNVDPTGSTAITTSLSADELSTLTDDLLDARREYSRYNEFPSDVVGERTLVPFDPRIDVSSKSMTLEFTADFSIPQSMTLVENGAFSVDLQDTGELSWTIVGVNEQGDEVIEVLTTPPLSDVADIRLYVLGYKNDGPELRIYVNNELVAEAEGSEIENLLSVDGADMYIGAPGYPLSNINYHTNAFETSGGL